MYFEKIIPSPYEAGAFETARAFRKIDKVLVAAHVNLDGDAMGSLCACGEILKKLDKEYVLFSSSGVPHYLDFLQLPGKICRHLDELPFAPEAAIYLDCSEAKRLGHELEASINSWPSINIDHHICKSGLGTIANYIKPEAAAVSQLMAYIAMALDLMLTGRLAEDIALGIMTDTGGFCHGNTTADIFALCALLSHEGCNLAELREKLQNRWTIGRAHLWGTLLANLALLHNGNVAFCKTDYNQLNHFHCDVEDLEGLIDNFRKIRNVKVAILLRQEQSGLCKFSLRSHGNIDVRKMAAALGGGGHKNASGGVIVAPMTEAENILLKTVTSLLDSETFSTAP